MLVCNHNTNQNQVVLLPKELWDSPTQPHTKNIRHQGRYHWKRRSLSINLSKPQIRKWPLRQWRQGRREMKWPPSLRPSKSCFRRLKSDIGKVTVVCFTDGESKPALPFDELARPKGALGGRLVQGHLWPAFNYITKLMKKKFFTIRFDSEVHKNKTFVFAAFSKKIAEPPCKVNLSETPWGSDTFALLFVSSDLSQICPRPSVSSGVSRVNLRRRNTTPSPSDCQIGRELAEEKSDINTDYGREKRRGRATSVTRSSPTPN